MKKLKGKEAKFYGDHNIQPEFSLMSRKPGIARQYFDENPNCVENQYINVSTPKGGKKFRPPRYYDKLFDVECPEKSAELKALRAKLAQQAMEAKLSNTSLDSYELRAGRENQAQQKRQETP